LIVDLILPATKTPAAGVLDVHGYIVHQLGGIFVMALTGRACKFAVEELNAGSI